MAWLSALLLGYALGSIPFGLILTRLTGAGDLRAIGSGNIGATNVLRTGHKGLAAATLLLDMGKGLLAVLLAWRWLPQAAEFAAAGALLGHCFPVWLRFRGGKGVATGAGIVFALHWPLGLALTTVWLVMAFGFKISSLAALTAAALMPLGMFYVAGNTPVAWAMVPIALILVWRHQANIRQLLAGSERSIGR